jgi:glycosyltransferase involved in cell wall biosynthesis
VPARLVEVPEAAAREIPPYRGHRWYEPDFDALRRAMRRVATDEPLRRGLSQQAARDIAQRYSLAQGREAVEQALAQAEARLVRREPSPVAAEQVRVAWEGEFFARHSFSNINETLARRLLDDPSLALSLARVIHQPAYDRQSPLATVLAPYFGRPFPEPPQVTVRHAFPPNFSPPPAGRWVHIQPWEFGHLPADWVAPLRDQVDEIWAPSHYVRRVYERSGVPAEKIQVIPWGVDPAVFTPEATPRLLPARSRDRTPEERCAFLFVGGTIPRKGFDRVLEAYLAEFSPQHRVCLVIKDQGAQTFYRVGNLREQIIQAQADPRAPEIVYFDEEFTPGQLASLYTACQCLVAPYRGEGFGLPILEAMACGVPAIVPRGGASDDFVDDQTGYLLDSREVVSTHDWQLAGPALELALDLGELRQVMRRVYEHPEEARLRGQAASCKIREQFPWTRTAQTMAARLRALAAQGSKAGAASGACSIVAAKKEVVVSACLVVRNAERTLDEALARVCPFVGEVIVVDLGSTDRTAEIAREYGAAVIAAGDRAEAKRRALARASGEWVLWLRAEDRLDEQDAARLEPLLREVPAGVLDFRTRLDASRLVDRRRKPRKEVTLVRREAAV